MRIGDLFVDPIGTTNGNQAKEPFKNGIYTLPTESGWGMQIDQDYLESVRVN